MKTIYLARGFPVKNHKGLFNMPISRILDNADEPLTRFEVGTMTVEKPEDYIFFIGKTKLVCIKDEKHDH